MGLLNGNRGRKKGFLQALNNRGGGNGILIVFMFFFFTLGLYMAFMGIVKSQHRLAGSHRDQSVAIQMADSALDQVMSKIRNHQIILPQEWPAGTSPTPTGVPTIVAVPVGTGRHATTAYVKLDVEKDASNVPVRDLAGNLKYKAQAVVEDNAATGANSKLKLRRGIKAQFSIVNFGRYAFFGTAHDAKAGLNYSGHYHSNGNLTITSNCTWNNARNLDGTVNTFYAQATTTPGATPVTYGANYTTIVAGNFVYTGATTVYSQGGNYPGSGAGSAFPTVYTNTIPTAPCPNGTWFDGAHGGFVVNLPPMNTALFKSVAQVVIDVNDMETYGAYFTQGAGLTGTGAQTITSNQMTSAGVSSPLPTYGNQLVRINLSALNKGRDAPTVSAGNITDYQQGDGYLGNMSNIVANYHAALASEYGIVIYVNGDAAVWGQIPNDTAGSPVTAKRVTIVATGNIQAIGDILYSDSPYAAGGVPSSAVSSVPTYNNPNKDGIAIMMNGLNYMVNPWLRANGSYFVNQNSAADPCNAGGDIRMDGLYYLPNGVTGGQVGTPPTSGRQVYLAGGFGYITYQTHYGCVLAKATRDKPACGISRMYDSALKDNLSSIIPYGTTISSWQEELNPPILP